MGMMIYTIYIAAALAEIAGCYCIWLWLRLEHSILWVIPGIVLLLGFAILLTLAPSGHAGRAFAAYGGVYIAASLGWLWIVERQPPTLFDIIGGMVCIAGAAIIVSGAVRGG